MKQMTDYVIHYERNSTLKSAVLRAFDTKIFSLGTDFKRLSYLTDSNDYSSIKEYLASLAKFAEYMAATNFPLLVNTSGQLANSSASIFTSLPFVYCKGDTRLKFNDADFQSPLTGGSSFTLSRLPNGLGTYLALTGNPIQGEDLKKFGFVKEFLTLDGANLDYIKNYSSRTYEVNEYKTAYRPMFGYKLNQKADTNKSIQEFFDRSKNENGRQVLFDLYYRKKLIETSNYSLKEQMEDPEQWIHHEEDFYSQVENFILCFENDVLTGIPFTNKSQPGVYDENTLDFISRIFTRGSLREIYEALDMEQSDVAKTVRAQLENKNQLILSLTLQMLAQATNLSFNECLMMEYETALSLAQTSETKDFAFKPYNGFYFPRSSLSSAEDLAGKILRVNGEDSKALGLTASALLPTKDYYQRFPEAFRCFFNNQSLRNPVLAPHYKDIVRTTLMRYGIDYLNPTFDKEFVITKLRLYFDWYRKFETKSARMVELAKDPLKVQEYISRREHAIDHFTESKEFTSKIEKIIDEVFKDEIQSNEDIAVEKSAQAQLVLKQTLVQRLKDFVMTHRLTQSMNEGNMSELLRNLPLEINQNRFILSDKTKERTRFNELNDQHNMKLKVKSAEDIKDALKNGVPDFREYTELDKISNEEIVIDTTEVLDLNLRSTYWQTKLNLRDNERMALALYLKGMPKAEKGYRADFTRKLLRTIQKDTVELTPERRKEIIAFINEKFFKDFEERKTLDKIIMLSREQFFNFCNLLKPSYETVDIINTGERELKGTRTIEVKAEEITEQQKAIQSIKALNSIDLTVSETGPKEFTISSSKEDMISLILSTQVLSPEQRVFFKHLVAKQHVTLFADILNSMHEIYSIKFTELFGDEPIKFEHDSNETRLSGVFRNHFIKESKEELMAFFAPHLFYNISNQTIDRLDSLYTDVSKVLDKVHNKKGKEENTYAKLGKILADFKINVNTEKEFEDVMVTIDEMLTVMVDLQAEYKSKIFFKEDLLNSALVNAKEVLHVKMSLIMQMWQNPKDSRLIDKSISENKILSSKKMSWSKLSSVLDEVRGIVKPDQDFKEIQRQNENKIAEEKKFDHAVQLEHFSEDELATYVDKLKAFFDVVNATKYTYGFRKKDSMLDFDEKDSKKLKSLPVSIVSKDTIVEKKLSLDAFIKQATGDSKELVSVFRAIHNLAEKGRLQRLILNAGKCRATIFNQLYTRDSGRQFEQYVRPEFLKSYYESHHISKEVENHIRKKTDPKNTTEKMNKIPERSGIQHLDSFASNEFGQRYLTPGAYPALLELERQGKRLMHGGKASGLEDFYYKLSKDSVEIPKAFSEMDFRQNPQEWVEFQVYLYLKVIFNLRKQIERRQGNLALSLSDYDLLPLLTPERIRNHLKDKLYHELIMLENIKFTNEEHLGGAEARMEAMMKTSPELLDVERVIQDEKKIKKYLAFEAFAFEDRGQNDMEIGRNIRYLMEMDKEFDTKEPEDLTQKKALPKKETKAREINVSGDSVYSEIFKVLGETTENSIEALNADLSKTIRSVSERISLYK